VQSTWTNLIHSLKTHCFDCMKQSYRLRVIFYFREFCSLNTSSIESLMSQFNWCHKNVWIYYYWWKIFHWLIVWSTMSIISLKSLFSSDEILMKFYHSSFINEFKYSLTLMKSFSSLSIINLASSSSSFHSSKSRTSLHWLVIFKIQRLSFLWLLF